jgi:hypothetical protein
LSPSPGELHNRLSIIAKEAADEVGLRPDTSAQDYLGALVNQAAQEIGDEASPADMKAAEGAFRRLSLAVAADKRPGIDRDGPDEQLREAALRPVDVSGPEIRGILEKLCPGFFPFC